VKRRAQCLIERRGFVPDLHKNILHDFFRFVDIAQDPHGGREKDPGSLIVELRQCLPVLRRNAMQQPRLRFLSCSLIQHSRATPEMAMGRWRIGAIQFASSPGDPPEPNCTDNLLMLLTTTHSHHWMPSK